MGCGFSCGCGCYSDACQRCVSAGPKTAKAAAKAAAAPTVQSTAMLGASQPGGSPWQGNVFLNHTLPQNFERLRRECPHLHLATSVGQAVDMAHGFQEYLPLPVEALVNFNILEALDCIGGGRRGGEWRDCRGLPAATSVEAVVAERIPRISDINRPPFYDRIDLFVYCSNGDVIRHHPRRTARRSMHPHRMPFGSSLFSLAHAMELGVGTSLHTGRTRTRVFCTFEVFKAVLPPNA